MGEPNEVHLTVANNGHILSTDCWCEPSHIEMVVNKHGIKALVVHHEDYVLYDRNVVIGARNLQAGMPYPHDAWITRALENFQTKSLPPHDPNERSM